MGIIQGIFAFTMISFRPKKFEEDLRLNFEEQMDKCDDPKDEIVKLANIGLQVVRQQPIIPATTQVLYLERNNNSILWSFLPKNMSALFLNENNIQYNSYYENPNLKVLSVRKCRNIESLISNLDRYKNLVDLDISSNNINFISGQNFSKLKSLQHLSISYNNLINITSDIVANLKNLRRLNLRGNRIAIISKSAFMTLKKLEKLDLADNHMIILVIRWLYNSRTKLS
ncbi:hypothetical protein HZH68_004131 [Vespula germanica]|uniref:Uncharacterized protein n=1 Tax=Vespula germanica TaxID=30212 RepID=A0A834KN65_VESGE|nr:hypothetical protein HZH68_004131 [Vespula germanica]